MRAMLWRTAVLIMTLGAATQARTAEPASGARELTLDQAVELALRNSPRMKVARANAEAQADQARSARGHLLPTVAVSVLYANSSSPEDVNVKELIGPFLGSSGSSGSGGAMIPSEIPLKGFQAGLGSVAVAQPITGLFHLSEDYAAASDEADASAEDARTTEADVRLQVETGLLTLFEARALIGIAKASRTLLQDQLELTQAELKAGVLTRADVLRVQVAVANADQQIIQAEVQDQVARASLLTQIGYPPEATDITFAEPKELESRQAPSQFTDAEQYALSHRHEITSATQNQQAAHESYLAASFRLLPEISASGSYMRIQNLPSAIPPDYFLFELSASWPIWQWGSTYYAARAAEAREDAAAARVEGTRQQVSLEVDQRLAEERAAAHAVSVAQDAIQQAEEAFRVTEALVKAGSATTTDLLDAQSALTQARLNLVRAKYQDLRARAALTRALGA
jgi:outer membrane protein